MCVKKNAIGAAEKAKKERDGLEDRKKINVGDIRSTDEKPCGHAEQQRRRLCNEKGRKSENAVSTNSVRAERDER